MNFFTYKIINKINNKLYFGWTNKDPIQKRLEAHIQASKQGSLLLHNAIRKHGPENFTIELVNTFTNKDDALNDEIRLIAEHNTNHCRTPNGGYNMTDGGEGVSGRTRTPLQKEASKQAITEYNKSTKGKTYEELYGPNAELEKQKRANSNKGRKATKQQKEKMSAALKGNKNGCFAVRVLHEDGRTETFSSQTEAMASLGIKTRTTLRSIASGKRWRNGVWEKYNNPYPFSIELLRTKINNS